MESRLATRPLLIAFGFALASAATLWSSPAAALTPGSASASASAPVVAQDYLGLPGPETVGGEAYRLAFTVREPSGRILQEYLPAGQALEGYSRMLLVDYAPGKDSSPLDLAQRKFSEIVGRRDQGDTVANGQLLQSDSGDSVILDFILSAELPDGRGVVEWNVYQYQRHGEGVLLTAWSKRAYGDEQALDFMKKLKEQRAIDVPVFLKWKPNAIVH